MKTENHEVILAIVNAGFAEEAMDVARECGARGVTREDAAAFFGISIHADKEILMIVAEKDIRDAVLKALYQRMGMDKHSQGIAFSLPVSDAAGLIKKAETKPEETV